MLSLLSLTVSSSSNVPSAVLAITIVNIPRVDSRSFLDREDLLLRDPAIGGGDEGRQTAKQTDRQVVVPLKSSR